MLEYFIIEKKCTIKDFAYLLGVLNAACPAVAYDRVHCKRLERERERETFPALLTNEENFEAKMLIRDTLIEDLEWWKVHGQTEINPIRTFQTNFFGRFLNRLGNIL